jgi:polar amino acid transport system permease protein
MNLINNFIFISEGLFLTILLTISSFLIGFIIALFLALLKHYNHFSNLINLFIFLIRGTPLILQLCFFYFVLPKIFNTQLELFSAAVIAFTLNSAAYITEILRAGISNVAKEQFHAAYILKIPQFLIWKDIILPQVIRNIFPALVNELITLLKDTSIIATLGGLEITRKAQILAAEQYNYLLPLCMAAIYYLILVKLLEVASWFIEKKVFYATSTKYM